ncbi:competence damage-inducible protein A [Nocardioides psychrotolerans]|uniref:Nicotinamide-nucleotide amidase/nicotinamide-nucleotide amidase n=1 Tax=Nocardioides psychrotolerans TaxID=1005945 RepID=A0A1I3QB98_9ACTN|nr:CinA family protein [Nocardioides psychrotolerans]GEP40033.1 competence damage-inducible protein A [Nocardioides psychrotolerans]SFJ31554.1 nicotinamide-nucleotide amidase/nicotinamide-nucleotide amidase [Nocardioides psychrotolerans]
MAREPRAATDEAALVHGLLRERGASLATAESLTGGQLAARLTAVPGASETYVGGVVTYATELKVGLLGVARELVERHGVVSAECARAMASGVLLLTGADFAIATTGVAGPGEQEGRPAGTVYVAVAGPGLVQVVALELSGERADVQRRTCEEGLSALAEILRQEETPLR